MEPQPAPTEPVENLSESAIRAILAAPFPSYQWPLDLARRHARSQHAGRVRSAVALLRGLLERYPQSLAIGQELIFALIESREEPEAEAVLTRLERTFPNLDMELLCRWGRLFKDRGDAHSGSQWVANPGTPNRDVAIAHYRKSIAKYHQAFGLDEHYYPGINEATLTLILVALETTRGRVAQPPPQVAELAEKVDASRSLREPGTKEDETLWKPATRGEARLLLQDWGAAAGFYGQALGSPCRTPHAMEAMRRQVHRIAESFRQLGVTPAAPFDGIDAFFQADRTRPPDPAPAATPTAA